MEIQYEYEMGVTVRDKVTGFKGIITAVASYITGCNQYAVTTRVDKDGSSKQDWYDEQRLEAMETERIVIDNSVALGGPRGAGQAPLK